MTNPTIDPISYNAGIEAAKKAVAKRREDYVAEHGSYDPSTGVTEFPGNGDEYVGELDEIEELIGGLRRTEPQTAPDASEKFWLILREPGKVPERKGAFPHCRMKETLREFIDARPSAFITVLTISHGEPHVEDAPEWLEILDGRSASTAAKHRASSAAAFSAKDERLFDLLEGIADRLDATPAAVIRCAFARATGGADIPYLIDVLSLIIAAPAPADAERLALAERIDRNRPFDSSFHANLPLITHAERNLIVSSLRAGGWREDMQS